MLAAVPDPPVFTDDPLTSGTAIRAVHITELRTAINDARTVASLAPASWGESIVAGTTFVKASHITEMRLRLDEARSALGLSTGGYTDPNLAGGYWIAAVHISDLRSRVLEIFNPTSSDAFVQSFIQWGLGRAPNSLESAYWADITRSAHANGQGSMILAMRELGRSVFESAEYAGRGRDNHWYVHDLYRTYFRRAPDAGGWQFHENNLNSGSLNREQLRRIFDEWHEFTDAVAVLTVSGAPSATVSSLASAQVDPFNQPGNGLASRDAQWSLPLVSLPGRAGLDLGLSVSYSSMVWTGSGPYLYFDEEHGSPSPGFRLGFPAIHEKVFDAQAGDKVFVLSTPAGRRVSLRQIGTSNIYEAGDSSYLQLIDYGTSLVVRSTDGTQMSYGLYNDDTEWRCTQIKDRNGNLINVQNNVNGQIQTVTDTLGRVITFNYDGNSHVTSITQTWNGVSHTWVTFGWGTQSIGSLSAQVVGTYTNEVIPVLTQVGLHDGSRYNFDYNSTGQVNRVRRYTFDPAINDYGERSDTDYEYQGTDDCPRLYQVRVSAQNWTGTNGLPDEVTTQFADNGNNTHQMTAPDGTVYKEFYGTGWQRGLVTASQVLAGGSAQKTTYTSWTQDNTSVNYQTNPRVNEVNIYDASNNRRRTTVDYSIAAYTQYGLPYFVSEYAANGTTEIRRSYMDYNLAQSYLNARIIGLVSARHVLDPISGQWVAKTTYTYDSTTVNSQATSAPGHDQSYNSAFTVRGNVTGISRWNVNAINNAGMAHTTSLNYDAAGNVLSATDPSNHTNSVGYTDSFSDGNNSRGTFAYPTTMTDADGFSSAMQYHFDFGGRTRFEGPPPQGQSNGIIQTFSYDGAARPLKVTTANNNAYTRYVYGPTYVQSLSTVNNVADEAYTGSFFDGLGRTISVAKNHPGSSGGYSAAITVYDAMGRAVKHTNPTEITSVGVPTGDDAAGWQYNNPTVYDWQGRATQIYNMDGTYKEAGYTGCGCSGSEVVTLTDEVGRQQKAYSDVLGRQWKTEVLNWNGTVYSTTTNTFNARDQVMQVRQFAGTDQSQTYQDTTMSYDGYGRLESKHVPEQNSGTATTYSYNADDTINSVTDARGASATYIYNNGRHLVNEIHYSAPGGITPTSNVTFAYDAAGNRTSMTDGIGSASYSYNQLSQMTSETRTFSGLSGSFTLAYEYAMSGAVKKVTDQHEGTSFTASLDNSGRVNGVSAIQHGGGSVQYASQAQYRATGALKSIAYGNSTSVGFNYNNRGSVTSYSLSGAKSNGTPKVVGDSYQYYNDGVVKFAQDQASTNSIIDRAYQYDHASRLKEAYSGTEARDFINNTSIGTTDGPYRQSNTYDAWDNTLMSGGRLWSRNVTDTASYNEFNRNPNWIYDAEGNLLSRNEMMGLTGSATSSYDAAGRRTQVAQTRPCWLEPQHLYQLHVYANTQTYDGDGQMTRYEQSHRIGINGPHGEGSPKNTYYLRSTVLGGRVISEYDGSDGQTTWSLTYVYAGSQRIGTLSWYGSGLPRNFWRQNDPVTGDEVSTLDNGEISSSAVFDPDGVDVGIEDPFPPLGEEEGVCVNYDPNYVPSGPEPPRINPLEGGSANCVIDGIEQRCNSVGSEAAVKCPDEGCGPQIRKDGTLSMPYHAFTDGWGGFLPPGAIYDGEGQWHILSGEPDDPRGKRRKVRPEDGAYGTRFNHAGSLPQNYGPITPDQLKFANKAVADRYDYCRKKWFGNKEVFEDRFVPGRDATRLTLAAGMNSAAVATRIAGIFSQESGFSLTPSDWGGEAGPAQLSGAVLKYWRWALVDDAFGTRLVRDSKGQLAINNRGQWDGSVFDNMATARNIVMSYGSDYAAAYAYGPGHKDGGAADMRERHHYAGQVTARTPTYRNFFDCLLGKN